MNISSKAVSFDENRMIVDLQDGRSISVPLAWFPGLLNASPIQRANCELSVAGLHWDELDEDISVNGLLAGLGDLSRSNTIAA